MKNTVIVLILTFVVLQYSDAGAQARVLKQSAEEGAKNDYVFIYGGVSSRPDATIEFVGSPAFETDLDNGILFGGGAGTRWHDFRFELEIANRSNDVSDPTPLVELDFSALSVMVNGIYEINVGLPIKPYVGVGGGFAQVSSSGTGPAAPPATGIVSGKESDTVLAYQFMAGVGFDISSSVTIYGGYRYFETMDATIDGLFTTPFDTDFTSHEFLAGVQFRF